MALNAPLQQLPSMAAAGANLFPSISDALGSQWRQMLRPTRRHRNVGRLTRVATLHTQRSLESTAEVQEVTRSSISEPRHQAVQSRSTPILPHCLQHVRMSSLSLGMTSRASRVELQTPSSLVYVRKSPPYLVTPLAAARGFASSTFPLILSESRNRKPLFTSISWSLPYNKRRSFSLSTISSNISHNQLAHAERTANNNPTSASAQNAFYAVLLKANHPDIVRERYQTGRYASNEQSSAMYFKALGTLGKAPAAPFGGAAAPAVSSSGLNQQTMQAVGQAVAGGQTGAAIVTGGDPNASGSASSPLHVTVSESWGTLIFRWFKFAIWTAIACYLIFLSLGIYMEMSGAAGGIRSKGGKSAEVLASKQTVRFSDVHGCEEAKDELVELVEFLKNPERFSNLGGKLPKGVLLVGPPGTGKTLLAKAVAGESGCSFFYMSGSEFDEMYVGVGARRVRDLFNQARQKSPAIIFIDELDAVGGKRSERDPTYAKQTLNQLLTELDGFSSSSGIILIGATNYPQSLDKALTRPGRFDRRVVVPLPDVRGRIDILKHHMRNVQISTDVDATIVARGTPGFSGADLENLVNQAAIRASRLKLKRVGPKEFDWAKDRIMMGAENRSRVIKPKDKLLTAYHEAGHALVNYFTPGSVPLYKMTIIPRGMSLGATHFLPDLDDEVSKGFDQFLADIDVSMGGYVAEELIYGTNKITSGASQDIRQATETAHHMVTSMGYSRKLGNVDLQSRYSSLSGETKALIESEVRTIIEAGKIRATKILTEKRKELELLKDALMEYETLTAEEMSMVIKGEKLKKLDELHPSKASSAGDGGEKTNGEEKEKEPGKGKGSGIKLPDFVMDGVVGTGDKKA